MGHSVLTVKLYKTVLHFFFLSLGAFIVFLLHQFPSLFLIGGLIKHNVSLSAEKAFQSHGSSEPWMCLTDL